MSDDQLSGGPADKESWLSQKEQESVIVDTWVVRAGRQQELVDGLLGLFETLRLAEGFIDGGVYASRDGTKVLSYSRTRSAADQQSDRRLEDIRKRLQALDAIAVPHRDSYELAWVFTPPADRGPVSVTYGAF